MAQDTILKIAGIDVYHGSFQALWDVSVEVRRGEMLALIGANTAGKSTLLDTISGLLHPAKGSIIFEDQDISHADPYRIVDLGITQVPEGRGIFPEMTVLANLVIGSYTKRARANRALNLKKVYQLFPRLEERQSQISKTLSGGEQQMLVIGRGLMSEPKLMLIDEMSLGLAPIVINEIFKTLKTIRESGITILFVEQNVRKSIQESDRAYILENGRVALCGTSAELCEEEKVKKAYFGI
jgi:branched-chain amino acid transport system ATP-binding protein